MDGWKLTRFMTREVIPAFDKREESQKTTKRRQSAKPRIYDREVGDRKAARRCGKRHMGALPEGRGRRTAPMASAM